MNNTIRYKWILLLTIGMQCGESVRAETLPSQGSQEIIVRRKRVPIKKKKDHSKLIIGAAAVAVAGVGYAFYAGASSLSVTRPEVQNVRAQAVSPVTFYDQLLPLVTLADYKSLNTVLQQTKDAQPSQLLSEREKSRLIYTARTFQEEAHDLYMKKYSCSKGKSIKAHVAHSKARVMQLLLNAEIFVSLKEGKGYTEDPQVVCMADYLLDKYLRPHEVVRHPQTGSIGNINNSLTNLFTRSFRYPKVISQLIVSYLMQWDPLDERFVKT